MQPTTHTETATTPAEAARPEIPSPEGRLAPETAEAVREPVKPPEASAAHPSVVPPATPQIPVPKPTYEVQAAAAPTATEAANSAECTKEVTIEQHLAKFIADRLPAESAQGLSVEVVLEKSNRVTSEGKDGLHDIAINFKGGKLEDPAHAKAVSEQLQAALREHPAFTDLGFNGANQPIDHVMRCEILALEPHRLTALLAEQPKKHVTFIAHEATPAAQAAVAVPAPKGEHVCSAHCEHAQQPTATAEVAPDHIPVQSVANPVPQVVVPAAHQGVVAANDQHIAVSA